MADYRADMWAQEAFEAYCETPTPTLRARVQSEIAQLGGKYEAALQLAAHNTKRALNAEDALKEKQSG